MKNNLLTIACATIFLMLSSCSPEEEEMELKVDSETLNVISSEDLNEPPTVIEYDADGNPIIIKDKG